MPAHPRLPVLARVALSLVAALLWLAPSAGAASAAGPPAPAVQNTRGVRPTIAASHASKGLPVRAGPATLSSARRLGPRAGQTPGKDGNFLPFAYHGGPAMSYGSTEYNIFWQPPGYTVDPDYFGWQGQYLYDNQQADFSGDDLFAVDNQYYDTVFGGTHYPQNVHNLGGQVTDVDAFPAGACWQPQVTSRCLTLAQIEQEIGVTIQITGWPTGGSAIYNLYLPQNTSACRDGTNQSCAYTGAQPWCAIHGDMTVNGQAVVWAIIPYPTWYNDACASPGGAAMAGINLTSHEDFESLTNGTFAGWSFSDGAETGDPCAWQYPGVLTGPGGVQYNNQINGNYYLTQGEYSKAWNFCVATP